MELEIIANAPSSDFFSAPPKVFYIDFAYGDKRKVDSFIEDPGETYRYENGIVEQVEAGTKNQKEPISGMYFSEGHGTIGIDQGNNLAYMSFTVGRRYGRGFQYEIIDGKLGEEQLIWVS